MLEESLKPEKALVARDEAASMTSIALFHSVLGVRPGIHAAAERLRAARASRPRRGPVRRPRLRRPSTAVDFRRVDRIPGPSCGGRSCWAPVEVLIVMPGFERQL